MPDITEPADVSVVVAARNEASFVEAALESILAQQGVDLELIFIDDGSTDDTFERATAVCSGRPNCIVRRNPKSGKARAFNLGVSLSRGRWVCLFAGDDIMPPGALAERLNAVRGQPANKPVVGLSRLQILSDDPKRNGHVIPRSPKRGGFTGVSYLMNREAVARAFPVPEQLPNEDTWLELAVRHLGFIQVHSPVIAALWRQHGGNSNSYSQPFRHFNRKLARRMQALPLFMRERERMMTRSEAFALTERIALERARWEGDIIGILRARVSLVSRLRALGLSCPAAFFVRRRFYRLLSGW